MGFIEVQTASGPIMINMEYIIWFVANEKGGTNLCLSFGMKGTCSLEVEETYEEIKKALVMDEDEDEEF